MSYLDVPGAKLYYEVTGQGPVLLCISGGDGSCEIWKDFAQALKGHFTVVCYDRRGFSRSALTGAQDYSHRLETDADDAALLLKHITSQTSSSTSSSPSTPTTTTVIGNSSGAIVSLFLLTRHPQLIHTLIPYEPPLASVLPDSEALSARQHDIYNAYRAGGTQPAYAKFMAMVKPDDGMLKRMKDSLSVKKENGYWFSNTQYWFERELLQYPLREFDAEKELTPYREKLVFVNGEMTSKEPLQYRANETMAKVVGTELVFLPGVHIGHATHSEEFAGRLLEVLKGRGVV